MTHQLVVGPGPLGPGRAGVRTQFQRDASTWLVAPAETPARPRTSGDQTLQWILSTAIVVACWLTVRPLGITGLPGATTLLLLANSGFVLARNS